MKQYIEPEMNVIEFEGEDIIRTSGDIDTSLGEDEREGT